MLFYSQVQQYKQISDKISQTNPNNTAIKVTELPNINENLSYLNKKVDIIASLTGPGKEDDFTDNFSKNLHDNLRFNSEIIKSYSHLDSKSIINITWKKAIYDNAVKKYLDINWKVYDIQPQYDNTINDISGRNSMNTSGATLHIYNLPEDAIGTLAIGGFKVKETLVYSDGSGNYQGQYYRTIGSLDAQGKAIDGIETNKEESTAPYEGVHATFIGNDSYIYEHAQSVAGSSLKNLADQVFEMQPNHIIADTAKTNGLYNALLYQGVDYLVDNGSIIILGVNTSDGKDLYSHNSGPNGELSATYVHWMANADGLVAQKMPTIHYKDTEVVLELIFSP